MSEEVTIKVKMPKKLVDFLKDAEESLEETPEEYLERACIESFCADLEDGDLSDAKLLLSKKYSLQEICKDVGR